MQRQSTVVDESEEAASPVPADGSSSSGDDNADNMLVEEPPKKKSKTGRQRAKNFPKVIIVNDDGKKVFPFLKEKDARDYEIFKQLNAMDTPPWLEKGGVTAAWEKLAKTLSSDETVDPDSGNKLFPNGISGKMLKERFDRIASEMKKWIDSAPWRSGTDNEDSNQDDFVGLVEEVLSLYYDFCIEKEGKTKAAATEKEETAAFAKAMHDAAVGDKTAAEIRAIVASSKSGKGSGSNQGADTRNTTPSPSPRNSYLGNLDRAFQDSTQQLTDLGEMKKLKIEQKLKAQEMKQEKLQLEREKFQAQHQLERDRFEAEQRQFDAQQRQQNAQMQAQQRQQEAQQRQQDAQNELMRQMLEFMKTQLEKNK